MSSCIRPCIRGTKNPVVLLHGFDSFGNRILEGQWYLFGPSLGAATAIDFTVHRPETVSKLVLIDASIYSEGIGGLAKLPCIIAKAGLALLRSIPLRLYVTCLVFRSIPFSTNWDWMNASFFCHSEIVSFRPSIWRSVGSASQNPAGKSFTLLFAMVDGCNSKLHSK